MIFNTWDYYLLFLLPSATLFRVLNARYRPLVILASGSLFFLYFSYTQLGGMIGAACLGIFLWESLVSRFYKPGSWFCAVGVIQTILFLAVFKYRNFLTSLVWPIPAHNPFYWQNAFLPLGISFFTFEFLHYAVDRYKDRAEEGTVGEYMAFILFFPTMVAGPIKRYQDFLPKLRNISLDWVVDWQRGFTRILAGLVKKFAVADVLTAYTNHLNMADIALANRSVLALWIFAYGIKIYADFSAYSDIAIGSARIFGIKVPENFDWPYLQSNISDFWRHWHISLTTWLVDYVFIPLGGSRVQVATNLRKSPGNDAGEWNLARSGTEFHRVGPCARDHAGGTPMVAQSSRRRCADASRPDRCERADVRLRESGLGFLLYGCENSSILLEAFVRRVKP